MVQCVQKAVVSVTLKQEENNPEAGFGWQKTYFGNMLLSSPKKKRSVPPNVRQIPYDYSIEVR